MEATRSPSCSDPVSSQKRKIAEGGHELDCSMQFKMHYNHKAEKPDIYVYIPLSTYDPARGFVLGCHSSASDSESSVRDTLPFLDASASRSAEAALFFFSPLEGEFLSSSSS